MQAGHDAGELLLLDRQQSTSRRAVRGRGSKRAQVSRCVCGTARALARAVHGQSQHSELFQQAWWAGQACGWRSRTPHAQSKFTSGLVESVGGMVWRPSANQVP